MTLKRALGIWLTHRELIACVATAVLVRVVYVFPAVKRWYRESPIGRVLSVVVLVLTDLLPDVVRPFQRAIEARRHARIRAGMPTPRADEPGRSGR